jgi:hypothetical protein
MIYTCCKVNILFLILILLICNMNAVHGQDQGHEITESLNTVKVRYSIGIILFDKLYNIQDCLFKLI